MRRRYGSRQDNWERQVGGAAGSSLIAAIASEDIAPGTAGIAFKADAAFAATAEQITTWNDSGVTVLAGSKMYASKVTPLAAHRIVQAFICVEPEE